MRPVVKWEVGTNGVVEDYNPFQTAKPKLAENLGDFCSYCDRKLAVIALEVEHVHPKSIEEYASLKFKWENFLLACKNCNLVKDNNDLDFATTLFPHVHSAFFH